MIKREDLRVGEWYCDHSFKDECDWFKIVILGKEDIVIQNKDESHNTYGYEQFMAVFDLAPKPKKKIKLIGYMVLDYGGRCMEFREYAEDYRFLNIDLMKKVSERIIEVENE